MPGENYLINGKITAAQVLSLLRPSLEQLTNEIGRAFDYFQETIQGGKVDRIILFGGGAKLKGLPDFMNAELGLPVDIGDPLQDVERLFDGLLQNKEDGQRLVEAIGASLGEAEGINLLPVHLKERKKRSFQLMTIIGALMIAFGVAAAVYFSVSMGAAKAQEKVRTAKSEYQSLFPRLQALKDGLALKQYVRTRPDLGNILAYFSYLPSNVYLTDMNLNGDKIYLSGLVAGGQDTKAFLTQLVADLRQGILQDAKLLPAKSSSRRKDVVLFEIEGRIMPGGGGQ